MQTAALSIAYPGSHAIYNAWIIGGAFLASAMVLFHSQEILEKAKNDSDYDPLSNSIDLYLDGVHLFVMIVKIMAWVTAS